MENRGKDKERNRESGLPGGGKGRKDRVEKSGVYPASGPVPPGRDAKVHEMTSWGQGDRGAAGYHDHGESEMVHMPPDFERQKNSRNNAKKK